MQVPFIVLSYGPFVSTKKIFSIERDGIHTLPIFNDPATAQRYVTRMNQVLNDELNDPRTICAQICTDPRMALHMFQTITVYSPDLLKVLIDPAPPINDDSCLDTSQLTLVENSKDIDEVLVELQELVGSKSKAR